MTRLPPHERCSRTYKEIVKNEDARMVEFPNFLVYNVPRQSINKEYAKIVSRITGKMDVRTVLHMKGGEDNASYAKNSSIQVSVQAGDYFSTLHLV